MGLLLCGRSFLSIKHWESAPAGPQCRPAEVKSEGEIALEKVRGAKLGRTAMIPCESRVALRTNSKLLFEKIEWSAEVDNVLFR